MAYTVISYEGDEWVKGTKDNSWRWENEATIHLPDGRVFSSIAEARLASGPQWVEVRRSTVSDGVVVDVLTSHPDEAAFVNQLYRGYFGRAPDDAGWRFWVNEIVNNRKTRAGVEQAFAQDHEAIAYAASVASGKQPLPPVAVTPPAGTVMGSGILDGQILGVPTKLILLGAAAYFLLGSGNK